MSCKASVIIPVYNAEKTLRRCVESLVLGLERNIEVILCEDCSGDDSWKLCNELADSYPNIRAIQNEQNRGVSYTRNHALSIATGESVLFVDSDDWVSSQYARSLIELASAHPISLPICGQNFIDKVNGYRRTYTWDNQTGTVSELDSTNLFGLVDQFLLQQLWNKIFRRDIIEEHHIRFDETQSIGEDFQFVLDYMEAAKIKRCVVLNKPLYYYIRWNNNSLMSHFGLGSKENSAARLTKLFRICNTEDAGVQAQYQKALDSLNWNFAYQVANTHKLSQKQKRDVLREILPYENTNEVLYKNRMNYFKNLLLKQLKLIQSMPNRVIGKIVRERQERNISKLRKTLIEKEISIISQNCIGGVFYHDMGMEFLSPTINTFIKEPDFVQMVLNLRYYMSLHIVMRWGEEYPIGVLDDLEIHFMHYETCEEAKSAWERRVQRINYDRIIVLATDRNGFDDTIYEEWKRITYPKVLYTVHSKYATEFGSVLYPQYLPNGFIPDLIPKREFYKDSVLINTANNLGGHKNGTTGTN